MSSGICLRLGRCRCGCEPSSTISCRMRSKYTPERRSRHNRESSAALGAHDERRSVVDQHRRHGPWHSGRVSCADLRQVLSPRTSSRRESSSGPGSGHRPVHVPANRRAARRRHRVRCRSGDRGTRITVSLPVKSAVVAAAVSDSRDVRWSVGSRCCRRRRCSRVCLTALALVVALSIRRTRAAQAQLPSISFRAGVDLVSLSVTVSNPAQQYVGDLGS